MIVKQLRNILDQMIKENPECELLPIRLELTDDESRYEQTANYWLINLELHTTGMSGYEDEGELKLIGEQ